MRIRDNGFSLVELLVTLVVFGVVLAIAVPALSTTAEHSRATAIFHQLTASLAATRLGAVQRGTPMTLCPSRDGMRCRLDGVWEQGWISYLDPGREDQPSDPGLIVEQSMPASGEILVRATAGRHRIRFQPTGWASGANISLRLCNRSQQRLLGTVVVSNAGRSRTERPDALPGSCPYPP